jgi:hypothetical protein
MPSRPTFYRDARAVFRRHWKLLVLPIPLALLITIWVVVSTPTMYLSQAAIWSNITTPQVAQSAQAANGQVPLTPAAQQQSLLNELLATSSFRTAVASASPLPAWLQANPPSKLTPSGLTGLLHGTPSLDARIRSALLSGTSTAVDGPQVMAIGFQAQSARVAHDTLVAMLNTFITQRTALAGQSQGTFQIIDPPSTPAGPTSGASKGLRTILYGLIAGVIVSVLAVVVLTLLGERRRRGATTGAPSGNGFQQATPTPTPGHQAAMTAQAAWSSSGDPHAVGAQERRA